MGPKGSNEESKHDQYKTCQKILQAVPCKGYRLSHHPGRNFEQLAREDTNCKTHI